MSDSAFRTRKSQRTAAVSRSGIPLAGLSRESDDEELLESLGCSLGQAKVGQDDGAERTFGGGADFRSDSRGLEPAVLGSLRKRVLC